jgi:hypothetical protein
VVVFGFIGWWSFWERSGIGRGHRKFPGGRQAAGEKTRASDTRPQIALYIFFSSIFLSTEQKKSMLKFFN